MSENELQEGELRPWSVRVVVPPIRLPTITYRFGTKLLLPLPRNYLCDPEENFVFINLDDVPKNWRCVRVVVEP